jgi:hypothetical protein
MFNFRSTSELENFQNLILKYASKRNSYKPTAYRARNELAACGCETIKSSLDNVVEDIVGVYSF